MSIVTANNFTFAYPAVEKKAFDDVSFDIKRGEVLGVIDPIGAGKTTLCQIKQCHWYY